MSHACVQTFDMMFLVKIFFYLNKAIEYKCAQLYLWTSVPVAPITYSLLDSCTPKAP